MEIKPTTIPGVQIIAPKITTDPRGYQYQSFQDSRYTNANMQLPFVQDELLHSTKGVLRGLSYQLNHPQAKLITAIRGEIFVVAVDIRRGSATFGKWAGTTLNDKNHQQLYTPPGFAHGFCVLSREADVCCKSSDYHYPDDEWGIIWNDKTVNITWPLTTTPLLSRKDRVLQSLNSIPNELLPKFTR